MLDPDNYSLCERLSMLLIKGEKYADMLACREYFAENVKNNPRILMYVSKALLETGSAKEAEKALLSNGGLKLRDFREGDRFLDRLYRKIRVTLYNESYKEITVPKQFDFIVSDFKTE